MPSIYECYISLCPSTCIHARIKHLKHVVLLLRRHARPDGRLTSAPAGRAIYKMRKAIVEPIFGQIKEARGFRRFSFRGLERVSLEWDLICLTHNLLKLFRAGVRLQTI